MEATLKNNEQRLVELNAGPEVVERMVREKIGFGQYKNELRKYPKGDVLYAQVLAKNIQDTGIDIKYLHEDIATLQNVLRTGNPSLYNMEEPKLKTV